MPCSVTSDVVDVFMSLAAVPSPSGDERAVADLVAAYLRELGLEVSEDDAASSLRGNAGNLYCRVPASDGNGGLPLFFCAHIDTVPPDAPIEPVIAHGAIRNSAPTILGADNKASVAVMLEAVRQLVAEGRPHAGVELVLTVQEEVGLLGAKAFDCSRLHARTGFVYDHAASIGEIITHAPSQYTIEATFHGHPAHSGIAPEQGRSAIAAAARAIAEMRLGRIDDETSANVGLIRGGVARNIVPAQCWLQAETRSLDPERARRESQAMLDAMAHAANVEECSVETSVTLEYEAYRYRRSDPTVALAIEALERAGYEARTASAGGGADAHVFNQRGLHCLNLGNGMARIHTAEEEIAVADLSAMVDVTLALVETARTREGDGG
jgi:tripeptide aminopeptidase